jgi:hypothetical protein
VIVENAASKVICLLTFVAATTVSPPAHATRGPDDYGLWFISIFLALGVLAGLSAAIFFLLRFWARHGGRKEGSYWLTLLGCIVGMVAVVVLVRWAPLDSEDIFKSSIPYAVQLGLPLIGGIAGFFVWRRKHL